MAGNFALSFSLNFLSIFVHISGSIGLITLIWVSLERSFPPAEVEYRCCQFWSKVTTSKVEERPRLVTAGYSRHRSQWVKQILNINLYCHREDLYTCVTVVDPDLEPRAVGGIQLFFLLRFLFFFTQNKGELPGPSPRFTTVQVPQFLLSC